jgi:predicted outer membrane protein
MLRRIPRFLRVSVLVAVVLAVAVSVFQSWSSGSPGTGGWTQTQWGPLGPADRDLLVKVRQAGLWEQPTGQQAVQQATSPQVREAGEHISGEHGTLDEEVRNTADKLGVLLPTSPTAQQQGWMKEISAQTGSDYDRMFVQRLREAHGNVLPLITAVRVGTRNDLVRAFAVTANEFVTRHIDYLESTGLVDFAALPAPPSPGLLSGALSWPDLIVPILVFVAALLAAVGLVAGLRHRTATRPRRVTVAGTPLPAPPPRTPAAMAAIPAPRASPAETTGRRRLTTQLEVDSETTGPHTRVVDRPGETSGPYARVGARLGEASGPYARVGARSETTGESTGSHRLNGNRPGESTGPRHSTRR